MTIRYYDDSISNVIVENNYNALTDEFMLITSAYRALVPCFGPMDGYCKGLTGPVVLEYAVRKYYKSPFKSVIISKKTENQIRVFSISVGVCRVKASKNRVFGCKKNTLYVRTPKRLELITPHRNVVQCYQNYSVLLSPVILSNCMTVLS